jgi:RHS repeat-associated protein
VEQDLEIAAGGAPVAVVVQEAHYYGFGLGMAGLDFNAPGNAEHRYTYNGKEEVSDFGLGWLDYGARHYQAEIGRWNAVDPMAQKRDWLTPYNFVQNSPLWRIDPDGAFDFVLNGQGSVYWDKNANSQATTKAGEKYLGKTLTFVFNSYIDGKLWDGPGGNAPAGDKLTSTISLTGNENSAGELTGLTATRSIKVGETPIGTANDYFPGLADNQNKFGFGGTKFQGGLLKSTVLNFEQHASVSPIEALGLNLLGYDIVNVAQKLDLRVSDNNLSISAATDVFPSATLTMNGEQIMYYPQPSFKGTHGHQKTTIFGDNGTGGSVTTESKPIRPTPSFYPRFQN